MFFPSFLFIITFWSIKKSLPQGTNATAGLLVRVIQLFGFWRPLVLHNDMFHNSVFCVLVKEFPDYPARAQLGTNRLLLIPVRSVILSIVEKCFNKKLKEIKLKSHN